MGLAGLSIVHLLCVCDLILTMDELALFGMDPSENKDDLDEWSLVFEAVSQPDRIRNSSSVSLQPSCKSAPLPAPAYRHDLSVSRVHSRVSSSCQFGGLAPPSQPQPRFESRIEPSAGLPSPDVQHSVPRSLQMHHEISDVINLDASVDRHFNLLRPGNCQAIQV